MTELAIAHQKRWRFAIFTVMAFALGCQSSNFRAKELPAEFRSAKSRGHTNLDLAKIASPGTSEAVLSPGDLLEVSVATSQNADDVKPVVVRIDDEGTADIPVIGPVPVAGLEAFEASRNIVNLAIQRGMYRRPIVTVEIKSKAVNRITVLGAVNEPGVHELPRGSSDLISALAASGGLTEEASTQVEIIRQPQFGLVEAMTNEGQLPETNHSEIQLAGYQQLNRNSPPQNAKMGWSPAQTLKIDMASSQTLHGINYHLNDRDVIRVVARQEEMIFVTGLVTNPGQFELDQKQDTHLLDAVALAGGLSSPIADKVLIIRRIENQPEPLLIQASLSTAKKNGKENLRLQASDTISVEQTPATAVVDAVSRFFRLSFGVASNTF